MTKEDWLRRAGNLHQTCDAEQKNKNGSGRLTKSQATEMTALQSSINSHHGRSEVTYNEARTSLDEMFTGVKAGTKVPK